MTQKGFDFKTLVDNWPSPLVARDQKQLDKFSGGLLNARTLANADSLGTGPQGRVKVGRKVAYPATKLAEWMASRTEDTLIDQFGELRQEEE